MIVLFVHQNFPGQYKHLARHLADQPGNTVYFVSQPNDNWMRGVTKIIYKPDRPTQLNCHPYTIEYDLAVRVGLAVAGVCRDLRSRGVVPDLIIGHCGWGETLFLKDVFPDTPVLSYFEFYYHPQNVDVGFDSEFSATADDPFRLRTRNAINLLSFDATDWGHTPTLWQKNVYPPEMRGRISVLHEGVDTDQLTPDDQSWIELAREKITLRRDDEIITYVARNLEPYRGFHIFMRAVREIIRRRPKAHIIIVGGDGVSYGAPAPVGTSYRMLLLNELGPDLDMSRIHFLGQVTYEVYLNILRVSSAHIYLTYPFVLSWSFIEAMSAGCAIIGSDTPPVAEVLRHGENGLSVDFFSPVAIADRVDEILDHPDRMRAMRARARETAISQYDLKSRQLPRWLSLIDDLLNRKRPQLWHC